jgi:hypothetical protein
MERTEKSSNARTTRPQGFERHYNARPAEPKPRAGGYNGRAAAAQGFERGYNARPTAPQPEPARGNSNTRSSAPGNFPANHPDAGNNAAKPAARPSTSVSPGVRSAGRETPPLNAQQEPRPAYVGPPPAGRGDGFSRATQRARARLRGQSM